MDRGICQAIVVLAWLHGGVAQDRSIGSQPGFSLSNICFAAM
jgi:hypothetical protein